MAGLPGQLPILSLHCGDGQFVLERIHHHYFFDRLFEHHEASAAAAVCPRIPGKFQL